MFKRFFQFIKWLFGIGLTKESDIKSDEWLDDITDDAEAMNPYTKTRRVSMPRRAPAIVISPSELLKFFTDIGLELWRLRRKMIEPGTDKPFAGMERAYRHVESLWDVMSQAGLEVRDHTDEIVPEGGIYELKAIAYQPTAGITRDKVLETIKPSIFYKNIRIQKAEVIIATPEELSQDEESFQDDVG